MSLSADYQLPYSTRLPLIDTHTHFDDEVFAGDRLSQLAQASQAGVTHILLIGYLRRYFQRMWTVQALINRSTAPELTQRHAAPQAHVALGLHPLYIDQHQDEDLHSMWSLLSGNAPALAAEPIATSEAASKVATKTALQSPRYPLAIGEIGLDTYLPELKQAERYAKQQRYFIEQLDMAVAHQLPVLLHIRKAHADSLRILKQHAYDAQQLGGIAHSFSGGEQEAKAFVKLGFKLGVTGQITNPNAKKLRRAILAAVAEFGLGCLVIETDCPDMTPIQCQHTHSQSRHGQAEGDRNVPANLPYVLLTLSQMFAEPVESLARKLWQNSCEALRVDWPYQP